MTVRRSSTEASSFRLVNEGATKVGAAVRDVRRVVHWYPNFLGGGGVANCVRGLAEAQARAGLQVIVAAAAGVGRPLYGSMELDGVHVHCWEPGFDLKRNSLRLRTIPRRERHALRALDPDLVHVHGEFNLDNWWVASLFDCPLVLSPQGAFHEGSFRLGAVRRKRAYVRFANTFFYPRLTFHATCPQEETDIRRELPAARIYCVPQAANAPVTVESRSTRPVGPVTNVLFAGRLDVEVKGIDILLEALELALRSVPRGFHLTLAGPDWKGGRRWIEKRCVELQISDAVRLTGALEPNELAREYAAADIYAHLSRREGFSLAIVEALTAGCPTILSDAVGPASFAEVASLRHLRIVQAAPAAAAKALLDLRSNIADANRLSDIDSPALRSWLSWDSIVNAHLARYAELCQTD
jgi:glycosyltransferase involved in cell wall biosynthesis